MGGTGKKGVPHLYVSRAALRQDLETMKKGGFRKKGVPSFYVSLAALRAYGEILKWGYRKIGGSKIFI